MSSDGTSAGPDNSLATNRSFRSLFLGWLGLLVTILICRWEIVDSPPYFDFAMSVWTEADYLARTGFDYRSLRAEPFTIGVNAGPRTYVISLIPGFIALLMKGAPTAKCSLVVYHLFTFACAAVTGVAIYTLFRPQVPRLAACLVVAVVLTNPIFSTQIDMMGMEIPTAMFAILAACALQRDRPSIAAFASLGSFLMKIIGILSTLSVLATSVALVVASWHGSREGRWRWGRGLLIGSAVLSFQLWLVQLGRGVEDQMREGPPLSMMFYWCPDLLLIATLTITLGIPLAVSEFRATQCDNWTASPFSAFLGLARRRPEVVYSAILVLGCIFAVSRVVFIPRYLTIAVPCLFVVFAAVLFARPWLRRMGTVLLALIVVLNLWNWNGALFPSQNTRAESIVGVPLSALSHEGSFLERSHEYLQDHRANIAAVRLLADSHREEPLIVGRPFTYFLGLPSLGYVEKPMFGYAINGMSDCVPGFKNADDLLRDLPLHPNFLRSDNSFYNFVELFAVPDPRAEDDVLFTGGDSPPVVAFRKGWKDGPPTERDLRHWYAQRLWPKQSMAMGIYSLLLANDLKQASETLKTWLTEHPADGVSRMLLAGIYLRLGQKSEAEEEFRSAVRQTPRLISARNADNSSKKLEMTSFTEELREAGHGPNAEFRQAVICLKFLAMEEAADHCMRMLEAEVPSIGAALSHYDKGWAEYSRGRGREATVELNLSLEHLPDFAPAYHLLGLVAWEQGDQGKAVKLLQHAIDRAPNDPSIHADLGVLLTRQDRLKDARQHFERAMELAPDDPTHKLRRERAIEILSLPATSPKAAR